jgi:hypothetical protein
MEVGLTLKVAYDPSDSLLIVGFLRPINHDAAIIMIDANG